MRDAETILGLIRERGKRGLPLEKVYRLMLNRDLFLMAYGKIQRNTGAMTHGVTDETPDGMSLRKIDAIIEALQYERYQWLPARRTYIPKKNGKKRPLGMPVWSDKLVQEVIRLILEAYYDEQFSNHSHGFRPKRGPHTALREIYYHWIGTTWFIEGDISQCFDKLNHELLLKTISEKIHDGRFSNLLRELFDAGYMEDWTFNQTLSGVPQGGIVSPILSNILLDKLDKFVETTLIPRYTKGDNIQSGKAMHRTEMVQESDFTIVATYQLEYRGIANYYRLAYNMYSLGKLKWVMEQSLTKTLATKLKVSVPKVYERYKAELEVKGRKYKGLQVTIPPR
jgi:retron-type reverse transcriptase